MGSAMLVEICDNSTDGLVIYSINVMCWIFQSLEYEAMELTKRTKFITSKGTQKKHNGKDSLVSL